MLQLIDFFNSQTGEERTTSNAELTEMIDKKRLQLAEIELD